jgi:WD40 repeat protein
VTNLTEAAGVRLASQITRDGKTLYTASFDGTVFTWDLDGTLEPRGTFPVVTTGQVLGIGFVPGSHLMVVGGENGFLALVDTDRRRVLRRLRGHRGYIWTPGISADGKLLATGSDDNTVRLWSLPDGRPLGGPLPVGRDVVDTQLSPDGRRLTIGLVDFNAQNGTAEVWDTRSRRRVADVRPEDGLTSGRFSPDGRLWAVGNLRGTPQVWSTATWKPVTRLFAGHAGGISGSAISRDGRTLATGSEDSTVRLWDIETEQAIGAPLPGAPEGDVAAAFTPDGSRLIASYESGRAYRWDIRPESLARHACQVAGRRLTRAEWEEFLPGRDYDPAC